MADELDQLLASLAQHPAWPKLRERAEKKMEQHFRTITYEFALNGREPDFARLQFQRGFFAGMKHLLDAPVLEDVKLRAALDNERKEQVA